MGTLYTQDTFSNWHDALNGTPHARASAILSAAKNKDPSAYTLLGQILLSGDGIEQDLTLAHTWFKLAAAKGDAMAFNMLGRCYEKGLGVVVNEWVAASFYQKAAELGLDWGQYNFANLLATGRGIEQNQAQAFVLYLKAANQGHGKSMNLVGRYYEEGISVTKDFTQALKWYERSAIAGDFRGQFSIASVLIQQGDIDGACTWLEQALNGANLNFLRTQRAALLAIDDPKIRPIAFNFFAKAATLGNATDVAEWRRVSALSKG